MNSARYAVVGNPIAHSKSPQIHAAFALQTGHDLTYERLLAPLDGFRDTVDAFRAAGGQGVNVTLPFKLEAFAYAARRSERATAAGAINALRFDAAGVFGDNTDGAGLVRDLETNLGLDLRGAEVLLLGAGGAARGVMQPLLGAGVGRLVVANRTVEKAGQLAARFPHDGRVGASGFEAVPGAFDIVINATSATLGGEVPPLAPSVYSRCKLAYEMMYGQGETPFLRAAREAGSARQADGLGMLVEQAAESFLLWRGVRPETAPVLRLLREAV